MRLLRCTVPLTLALFAGLAPARAALSLEEAIREALEKNFTLRSAALTPQIARADLAAAWGSFDPRWELSVTQSEDGNPQPSDPFSGSRPPSSLIETDRYEAGLGGLTPWGLRYSIGGGTQNRRGTFNAFTDQYYSFAGINVTQPLLRGFGFGSTLAPVRLARLERDRSEWEQRAAAIDLVTEVILSYNELHFARKLLETTRRSRELAAGLVAENERRFRVGSMSDYDVTAARARVARREEAILSAEQAVRDAENDLKRLISDARGPQLLVGSLEIEPPAPAPTLTVNPADDFPRALENRPDYRQAKVLVARAAVGVAAQRNLRLPQVDLVASLGYNGLDRTFGESRRQVSDRENRSYSAGLVVGVPLTFTTERARMRSARLAERQAELLLADLEQTIVVRLGGAAGQIETTQKRIEAARRARELGAETLGAELKKLRAGTSSTFVVLELQESLADLETREFRAHTDARRAVAEYDRQLGLTLQTHRIAMD
jgi:outer membrane protein TolC